MNFDNPLSLLLHLFLFFYPAVCVCRYKMVENPGCELDLSWINRVKVNSWVVHDKVNHILSRNALVNGPHRIAWLLRAVSCIDLTTLGGDDTASNVSRLCRKAREPISRKLLSSLGFDEEEDFTIAAVCVYPARVKDAYNTLIELGMSDIIPVASVATAFPSGQYDLKTKIEEIKFCVKSGASEIDVVVDRSLVLAEKWEVLYQELQQMKEACGSVHMKTILAVGELGSFTNIYKASLVAMMAGSDFIKTSTGKESVNATLPVGLVMSQAIRDYFDATGYNVGFKPAGGIRTGDDAINWLVLLKEQLGECYLNKNLFRIGASGLLSDIESTISFYVTGNAPATYDFTLS